MRSLFLKRGHLDDLLRADLPHNDFGVRVTYVVESPSPHIRNNHDFVEPGQ